MRKKIIQFIENPLISGSAIMFIGTFVGNICNFLFNFFMSRNLSVADYGTLASLVSLIMLASMPAAAVLPTVVKFAASYFAENEISLIKGLFYKVGKLMLLLGTIFFSAFVIFTEQIAGFFNIDDTTLIIIAGITVFVSFVGTVNVAFLQGKLQFGYLTFINLLGAILKLILGLAFVFVGYEVFGAMWAFALSYIIPFLLGILPLRFVFQKSLVRTRVSAKELLLYGAPASLALFSAASLISTDLILVKHFFSPHEAGQYAVLSLIGKIIFYFTGPISTVMFPMVVQKYTKNENYQKVFKLSLFLVAIPSILLAVFYSLFPEFTISVFNNNVSYLSLSGYLGYYAVFIGIYSICSVLMNFFLSINKTNVFIPMLIAAVMQAVGIWFFHDSFLQIIFISFAVVSLLLLVLLIYYLKLNRGKK